MKDMLLRSSDTSPFGRKVVIVAMRLGLDARFERVGADVADETDPLRTDNPLGKMPCLVLADGRSVFDSAVIVEYFDYLADNQLLPPPGEARIAVLTEQALFDGLTDAAVAIAVERRFRPEEHVSAWWVAHQLGKIERALALAVQRPPSLAPVSIGAIALGCSLGYLDWRKQYDWRSNCPALVDWFEQFRAAVPEFDATQHSF